MATPLEKRNELLAQKVIKGLESRHFEAYYCPTTEEALKKALEIIPEGSSVTWGGSVTVRELGLAKALNEGNYTAYDRDQAKSPEESADIMRKAFTCDYYVTSANAISEDGELVNVDGNGNRVAAICFGPKNVLVIAGMNKVAKDLDAAIVRARTIAAPINKMRFMGKTGCSVTGACENCKSQESICSQIVITRLTKPAKRIKVILVGEDYGF